MVAKRNRAVGGRLCAPAGAAAYAPLLADVLEGTLDCVCSIDRSWRFTYLNARAIAYFGDRNLVGRSIVRGFLGIRQSNFRASFRRAMLDRQASTIEGYLPERRAWYEMNVTPSDEGITVFFRDISDRKQAELAQAAAAAQLRTTLDNLPQMIWVHRGEEDQFYSRQWLDFTGIDPHAPDAPPRLDLVHPDDRGRAAAAWQAAQAEGTNYQTEYRLRHRSGRWRWIASRAVPERDAEGRVLAWYGTCTDCHEEVLARDALHASERRARWAASHDSLTGLANRALLQQRIDDAIGEAAGTGRKFALLLLDVDDFKRINDSVGHDAGDALLCTFAARLRDVFGPPHTVARLAGDEFAVILSGVGDEGALAAEAERLLVAMRAPCIHNGRMLDCHASIGASLFPVHGVNRAALLKNADVALYSAKSAGRANLKIFRPAMRDLMQKRASMLSVARDALTHDRILPYYQPKIDMRTGAIAGFEALLRWTDPHFGVQGPALLAAAFEDMNLAAEISDRIVAGVIADMRRWRDEEVAFGHVAVNAAAAEFRRGDFAELLLARLADAGLPPHLFRLEVTETVFLGRGAEYVERTLKALAAAGVKIALDDFGTGYASLSHLKQFPVHSIKIDQGFVQDLGSDQGDGAIIRAVVNLGRSLGIEVVAEGVENAAQHDFLRGIGCDQGQGFLYGRAVPAAEVPVLLGRVPGRREAGGKGGRQAA